MVSEMSRGFREDCFAFLNEFTKHESIEFRHFCHEWKKINFQYVFHGRSSDVEMVEFVNEALLMVKHLFISSKKPLEKIGAFYLLYALYFKQPTNMFCKIRVTPANWTEIKQFVKSPSRDSLEVPVIFWKLFLGDAFRFVQDEKGYGYDGFFVKGTETNRLDDKVRESFKIIKEAEKDFKKMKSITGLFTALDALEMGYNEMKESLDETEPAADKIPQSNLMQSLHQDLDVVIAILNTDDVVAGGSTSGAGGSGTVTASTGGEDQGDDLAVHSSENIGAKRSSLRERAFKRKVHKKDLQIASAASTSQTSISSTSQSMRPRATKKRDVNTSVLIDEDIVGWTSTDEDEPTIL